LAVGSANRRLLTGGRRWSLVWLRRSREQLVSHAEKKEWQMARMIRHERNLPYEVPEGTELPLYICACGLSKNKPFCDGSHRKTKDENAAETYVYDDAGRVQVIKQY
jgi:CDGSH-type Zn-finger protein